MGQIAELIPTKNGYVIARFTIKRVVVEVCDQHGNCRDVVRRHGVLTSIVLPDGRKVRRDREPETLRRLAAELGIPEETPLRSRSVCGDSRGCY